MKKTLLLPLILIIYSCSSDETTPEVFDGPIINIVTQANSIPDDSQIFYSVKGEDGSDIAFGELLNASALTIENDEYQSRTIALTLFVPRTNSVLPQILSYVGIERGKTYTFPDRRLNNAVTNTAPVQFANFSDFESIRLLQPGRNSSISSGISENTPISHTYYDDSPIYLIVKPSFQDRFQYQVFDLEAGVTKQLNSADNIDFENENVLGVNTPFSDPQFEISVTAETEIKASGRNTISLYNLSEVQPSSDNIALYTPSIEDFIGYHIDMTTDFGGNSYSQSSTIIPSSFNVIDPEITISESSLDNMSISTESTDVTFLSSYWFSNFGPWTIITPTTLSINYSIHEIPSQLITQSPSLQDATLSRLINVSAVRLDNLSFDEGLEVRFNPQREFTVRLSKLVTP